MRWRFFTLDIFVRATASTGRMLAMMGVELAFVAIGALIIELVFPRLDNVIQDSQLEQMTIAVLAREWYWVVVAGLLVHALLTGVILRWLTGLWLGLWLGLGMILPILVVVVPLVVVGGVYLAVLSDLTS